MSYAFDDHTHESDDQLNNDMPHAEAPESEPFVFEDLTLAQALGLMIYRPLRVGRGIWRVMMDTNAKPNFAPKRKQPLPPSAQQSDRVISAPEQHQRDDDWVHTNTEDTWLHKARRFLGVQFEPFGLTLLLIFATVFAVLAGSILRDAASDPTMRFEGDTGGAYFWLGLSFFMYGGYAVARMQRWWKDKKQHVADDEIELLTVDDNNFRRRGIFGWIEYYAFSLALIPVAVLMSYLGYARNVSTNPEGEITGIVFTTFGFTMWALAIAMWYIIFVIDFNRLYHIIVNQEWQDWKMPVMHWQWTHLVLIGILLLGGYFRLNQLDEIPPEMTSDHIEKLIDAVKVNNGVYAVFFENNGGREAFQMYTVAVIAERLDVGFNFRALKYATIIEGMLSILISFWVVKAVIGRENKEQERLGNWMGLLTAAFLAMSYWHVMLSRLGLRIVLTPLTVMLVTYFLVRGLRYGRRVDFVNMGVVLGLGTYFYQANRTLPLVVVAAVGLTMLVVLVRNTIAWRRDEPQRYAFWKYPVYLTMAGIVAIVAYLPMYHYSETFDREFWNRAYGRIFGENQFDCLDEYGRIDFCRPSYPDMMKMLREERYGPAGDLTGWQAFSQNYENAFISYMYEGDGQWITNANGYPALDGQTAGLYMIGFLMWIGLAIARRDVALMVVPLGIFLLIIPSALTIAPGLDENPSFTRMSGTAPYAFMLAALPLGLIAVQSMKIGRFAPLYGLTMFIIFSMMLNGVAERNFDVYFEDYRVGYERSWRPYSEIAAPLAEFTSSGNGFGNAFYVNSPHWLDHRVLGSVAGDLSWPNGLFEAPDVYGKILQNQNTPYAYNPEQPLLFYIHPTDTDDIEWLQETFPGGTLQEVVIPNDVDFYVYEAPPGYEWLAAGITAETTRLGCIINCLPGPR